MPTYKATWFFVSNKYNVGWTESWYCNGTNATAAYATVSGYVSHRLACLLDSASLAQTRVSAVGKPRDATYFAPVGPVAGGIPEASNPIAGVWDCLLCNRDIDAHTVLGRMYLRFVPGSIFNGRIFLGSAALPAAWINAFVALSTELTSGAYFLRTKTGGNVVYVSCTSFAGLRRTERKLGRPFDALHGRRKTPTSALTRAALPAR